MSAPNDCAFCAEYAPDAVCRICYEVAVEAKVRAEAEVARLRQQFLLGLATGLSLAEEPEGA